MQMIIAYIRPIVKDEVAERLRTLKVPGASLSRVDGFGREADSQGRESYGPQVSPYADMVKLEVVCSDDRVEELAARMASVPINQLAMQKMVINQTLEAQINQTQRLATVFDGITRHSPEGLNFKARAEEVGWKQAVRDRDEGTWDWTANEPLPKSNR